jgi:curved DNA-binding protein CbpA
VDRSVRDIETRWSEGAKMNSDSADHYEVLQVSRNAAPETIDRVFRFMAKRYHPDNQETGDAERFNEVVAAFRVLSNPEMRVAYDVRYDQIRINRARLLNQEVAEDEFGQDTRIRTMILSLLYGARREDVDEPGMGTLELERLVDCPEEHMKFHIWYLKSNGWIERLDNGQYAITASGVDRATREAGGGPLRLPSGGHDAPAPEV